MAITSKRRGYRLQGISRPKLLTGQQVSEKENELEFDDGMLEGAGGEFPAAAVPGRER
jgi:hypothetical protein